MGNRGRLGRFSGDLYACKACFRTFLPHNVKL
jgi:hypothetical protein